MIGVLEAIARIRRAMPRNAEVMLICDFAECNVTEAKRNVTALAAREGCPKCEEAKAKTLARVKKHRQS